LLVFLVSVTEPIVMRLAELDIRFQSVREMMKGIGREVIVFLFHM